LVFGTPKSHENISLIINNSAVYFSIVFKFGKLVYYLFIYLFYYENRTRVHKNKQTLKIKNSETNFEHSLLVKSNMADSG